MSCRPQTTPPIAAPSAWPRFQRGVKCWFDRWTRMRAERYRYVVAILEQTPLPCASRTRPSRDERRRPS